MVPSTTLRSLLILGIAVLGASSMSCSRAPAATAASIPRTAEGKPNLQGIWQVRNRASYDLEGHVAALAGRGIEAGPIERIPGVLARTVVTDPAGNTIQLGQPLGD